MQYLDAISKNDRMISVHFQGKPFSMTIIQVYAPTINAEEDEVKLFYEELHGLELTPKKDVLFIIEDWNAKVGSQEIPEVTGKFGLGAKNEAGQRLTVLPREHISYNIHPLPTTRDDFTHRHDFQQEMTLHIDITKY